MTSVCVRDVADQGYPTPGVYASATAAAAEPSSNQVTPPPAGVGLQLHTKRIDGYHRPVVLNWCSLKTHVIFFLMMKFGLIFIPQK